MFGSGKRKLGIQSLIDRALRVGFLPTGLPFMAKFNPAREHQPNHEPYNSYQLGCGQAVCPCDPSAGCLCPQNRARPGCCPFDAVIWDCIHVGRKAGQLPNWPRTSQTQKNATLRCGNSHFKFEQCNEIENRIFEHLKCDTVVIFSARKNASSFWRTPRKRHRFRAVLENDLDFEQCSKTTSIWP